MDFIDKDRLKRLPLAKQKEVLGKLEQLIEYKKVNPLYFYNHVNLGIVTVHRKQLLYHLLGKDIKYRALFGGNQSGKTTAGVADNIIQAIDEEMVPKHLLQYKKFQPPFYCRIFTPDLSATMVTVQEKMKELVPPSQLVGNSWDKAYNKLTRVTRFKNGSWFMWNSYDQEREKLGGVTLHRVHFDEEPPEIIYEESLPRIVRYNGDMTFTLTPLNGLTWMWDGVFLLSGGEEQTDEYSFVNKSENVASIVVDMDDNPTLNEEAKQSILSKYSPEVRKARKEGRFVHFAGLIYNDFKKAEHVMVPTDENGEMRTRPFEGREDVNITVGIDPGLNRTAVIWVAQDSKGYKEVFEELFTTDWTIEEICKKIHEINTYHGVAPNQYIIDPHAKDRSKQSGKSDQSQFHRHGIYVILGTNKVPAGIDAVKEELRNNRLRIHAGCRNLIHEFERYRWKEQPRSGEDRAEPQPIKKDDHGLDALRYVIMFHPPTPLVEEEDKRTNLQKMMDYDKEHAVNQEPVGELSGYFY